MRSARRTGALLVAALAGAALGAHPAAAVDPLNNAPCSVFDPAPCTPSFCGVFGPWPCVPEFPPVGQDLRLTVHSRDAKAGRTPAGTVVSSIRELFAALRACWEPPPPSEAFRGMQMSVRFSFRRTGEPVAAPRLTYASAETDSEMRQRYRRAIDAALERCTPMPFSRTMGGAIAGRPIAIRFIDDREDLNPQDSARRQD
jgi:hypothetical protein